MRKKNIKDCGSDCHGLVTHTTKSRNTRPPRPEFFFFYNLSLLYQWQWKAGVLDFHPGLHSDDVTGCGLGLTTHQREHHESTSELFFFFIYIYIKKKGDQMKCFNSTKSLFMLEIQELMNVLQFR